MSVARLGTSGNIKRDLLPAKFRFSHEYDRLERSKMGVDLLVKSEDVRLIDESAESIIVTDRKELVRNAEAVGRASMDLGEC